jgi:opacity protein-like surface antigen
LGTACSAFAEENGLYTHVDFGTTFVKTTPTSLFNTPMVFNRGIRGDVALGYQFNDNWSVEAEGGVIHNLIPQANGEMFQMPALLNVLYQIPLKHSFRPYLGAGVGAAAARLTGSFVFGGPSIPPLPRLETIFDTDFTFAFQATAGLNYDITQHISLGLGYKFLGTTDHQWTASGGSVLHSDGIFSNTVLASFILRF